MVNGYEMRDSVKEVVMVAVHDTIMEVTTVTVDRNEIGDTVRVSTVTDRDRVRERTGFRVLDSRVMVKTDTVFIEKRDSIEIRSRPEGQSGKTALHTSLRLVLWVIIGLIALMIVVRIRWLP